MGNVGNFEDARGPERTVRSAVGLRVAVAAATDIGKVRPNNEDTFLVFDLNRREPVETATETVIEVASPGLLVAVADGMGGHRGGQVASAICVESLVRELLATFPQRDSAPGASIRALWQAVEAVNGIIHDAAGQDPELQGMGTTLTAVLMDGSEILVGHVGDSRAYLLRDQGLYQLTTDQTVGNLSRGHPALDPDNRVADMLLQAVGAQPTVEVELVAQEIAQGDLLAVCCDGLYKVVSGEEIRDILREPWPLDDRVTALIERANENGGPDNITVVALEVLQL